ncbi:PREDICTED: cyclin-B2-2-like isoform X2 [Camelina sativa]|nr:PREDICTED: cyclin-B2-2-like isoform X2 [Camelina sativa]
MENDESPSPNRNLYNCLCHVYWFARCFSTEHYPNREKKKRMANPVNNRNLVAKPIIEIHLEDDYDTRSRKVGIEMKRQNRRGALSVINQNLT